MDEFEPENIRLIQSAQDNDLSDETQDFRFLEMFNTKKADQQSLPKRGEKDFEPDGTNLQERILGDSRRAMHDALCGERKHTSKLHLEAIWRPDKQLAEVKVARGTHFKTSGKADKQGIHWLLPEETIYLVERGNLECWWEEGIPMSLQGVYASCLDGCGSLERYQVFSYLKRGGYILQRAPTFDNDTSSDSFTQSRNTYRTNAPTLGLFKQIYQTLFGSDRASGPLVPQSVYRSYADIYRKLSLIPCHRPKLQTDITTSNTEAPFRIAYYVWKPRPHFKKSDPGEPDFRLAVVSAQETPMPNLSQISALFGSVPFNEKFGSKNQFQRLKEGQKNAILAVVDAGVISFVRFNDVGFGDEELYLKKAPTRGGKGGGGRGGKGGGRGGARGGRPPAAP